MLRQLRFAVPVVVLVALVGCQPAAAPASSTDAPASDLEQSAAVQTAPPADAAPADATPAAVASAAPAAADAVPETPPTPPPAPTPKPTPRPLPTPVAPSQALDPAAATLESKLNAFRAALRAQDVSTSLRLQRELLAAADDAEAALKGDKSPEAQSVRGAIAGIRSGVAGDNNGLDHAATALRQVVGGGASGLGVSLQSDHQPSDPAADLHTLNEHVRSFREAIQGRKTSDALRLQGQLLNDVEAFEKVAAADPTSQGKQLRDALALLKKHLDSGDSSRLAAAASALDKLDAAPAQPQVAPDLPAMASSLATKVDAFETAKAAGSQADLLRLQDDILAEAAQDMGQLSSDSSPDAATLRDAIGGVRASVQGDFGKLGGARAKLGTLSGGGAASAATDAAKPIADLKHFAADMDGTVAAFQDALRKNDAGAMLRLRKQLADQTDQADASLKTIQSKPAQQVLAAVGAIHTAFAGDLSKLDDARTALRAVGGAGPAPASSAQTQNAGSRSFDAPAIVGGVRDRLTGLRDAVRDPHASADDLASRRDALKAEVGRAEAALQGVNDPRADKVRSALTAAREAATGDDAKAASALTALQAALGS